MRKMFLVAALAVVGISLGGCWDDHAHGWGNHRPGHYHDHEGYGYRG